MGILDLIPGVSQTKLIMYGICLVAIISCVLWVKHEWNLLQQLKVDNAVLTTNNKTLQGNNDTLKNNINICSVANKTNNSTIESLKRERNDAKTAIAELAARNQSSKIIIGTLKNNIDVMKKNPDNDGPIKPILRETIRGIQKGAK